MLPPTPPLGQRIRGLVVFGLAVGLIRYVLEFVAPEQAWWFGVYYLMPIAFLVVGVRGTWGPIRWLPLLGTMFVVALIVWGIPNCLAYTTGQFLEWSHGRFYNAGPDGEGTRAAPIAATALGKIGWGVAQGALTSIAGTVWCTAMGTVLIWLPGVIRSRAEVSPDRG